MGWIERDVLDDLPKGWGVAVERAGRELRVQCRHVVLGGHEFRLEDPPDASPADASAEHVSTILDRLGELGLLEASRRMPKLTDAEAETLRATHAMIGAARLSHAQARSVMGLSQALGQLSDDARAWGLETVDLLEPWHRYPPDPPPTRAD